MAVARLWWKKKNYDNFETVLQWVYNFLQDMLLLIKKK